MLAKRRSALRWLHQAIKEDRLKKRYLALLSGNWQQQTVEINVPLRKNTLQNGERVVRVDADGKSSRTNFYRLRQFATATLVEVRPHSGRTHQIRVHAAHMGFPVAGDDKYGDREANAAFKTAGLRRLFLHASALSLPLPDGQGQLEIKASLDLLLEAFLHRLDCDQCSIPLIGQH